MSAGMDWAVSQSDLIPLRNAFRDCYSAYTATTAAHLIKTSPACQGLRDMYPADLSRTKPLRAYPLPAESR
jgi:hypothetical protein